MRWILSWGPVQHWAAHVHSALSTELHPLITVQRSRQGSPEYAYLPGSLEAAQVSSASWQSITGHMGRAPQHLPATSFTWTTTPRRWAGEERRHPPLQWGMISLAVDFLIHISVLLVTWRALHLQSGDSKQIYGNGPTLAGDRQLPQCVVLKQIPLPNTPAQLLMVDSIPGLIVWFSIVIYVCGEAMNKNSHFENARMETAAADVFFRDFPLSFGGRILLQLLGCNNSIHVTGSIIIRALLLDKSWNLFKSGI